MYKHVSTARKVATFLSAEKDGDPDFHLRLDKWLLSLERHVVDSMPKILKGDVPELSELWAWAEGVSKATLAKLRAELQRMAPIPGCVMNLAVALEVQAAIIIILLCGCEVCEILWHLGLSQ